MQTIHAGLDRVGGGAQALCSIGVIGAAITTASAGSIGGAIGAALGALGGGLACAAGSPGGGGGDMPDDSHSYVFGA